MRLVHVATAAGYEKEVSFVERQQMNVTYQNIVLERREIVQLMCTRRMVILAGTIQGTALTEFVPPSPSNVNIFGVTVAFPLMFNVSINLILRDQLTATVGVMLKEN